MALESRRCHARRTNGEPCKAWAITNMTVCRVHGGSSPQAKRAARRRYLEQQARQAVAKLGDHDLVPVDDPIAEFELLLARSARFIDHVELLVEQLRGLDYQDRRGIEDAKAVVQILERAMDRHGKLLVEAQKLGLEERKTKVVEVRNIAQAQAVFQALERVLFDPALGLSPVQVGQAKLLIKDQLEGPERPVLTVNTPSDDG